MKNEQSQENKTPEFRITFPPPDPKAIDLPAGQEIVFNNVRTTVQKVGDQLEIIDPNFIQELLDRGFQPGRNNTPERLAEILKNVPDEYKQVFMDGVMGK